MRLSREDSSAQRRRTLLRDSNPVALCALPEQEQVDQHRQKSPRFAIAIRLAVLAIPEIVLAKISALRYIAFWLLIRYFDGRVALTTQ
jgi:hypothetical protein